MLEFFSVVFLVWFGFLNIKKKITLQKYVTAYSFTDSFVLTSFRPFSLTKTTHAAATGTALHAPSVELGDTSIFFSSVALPGILTVRLDTFKGGTEHRPSSWCALPPQPPSWLPSSCHRTAALCRAPDTNSDLPTNAPVCLQFGPPTLTVHNNVLKSHQLQ